MRPPDLLRVVLNFVGVLDAWHAMSDMLRNAAGNISAAEKTFIPEQEQPQGDPHRPHLDWRSTPRPSRWRSTSARSCR